MKLGKWIFLFVLNCILTFSPAAQAQSAKALIGWRYIPAQADSWSDFTKNMEAGAYKKALSDASEMKEVAKEQSEIHEANLAAGKALKALGFPQAAFYLFTDIVQAAPGSFAATESLIELDALLQSNASFDEELLSRVINRAAPSEAPEQIIPMIGYYMSLDHLAAGQTRWMKNFTSMIKPGSFWGHRLEYFKGIELVKEDKLDEALGKFEDLAKLESVHAGLKHQAQVQIARILFEKTDYPAAEKAYSDIRVENRNSGRLLYERAWNQYYLKDYALTLGMLESLKAPYFTPSLEPEQYVLSSLALRDLCHYPEVQNINKQFFEVFEPVIEHVRAGKPLIKNSTLLTMALVREPFRSIADVVDAIQKEGRRIDSELSKNEFTKGAVARYAKVEKEIRGRLERRLETPLRQEANRLLDLADQMKLLDYVSGLDENRIQGIFESRGYKAERPDTLRFNTLFWPLRKPAQAPLVKKTEYWFEELTTLRVLISDRCQGAM